jgi:hypothetical protein
MATRKKAAKPAKAGDKVNHPSHYNQGSIECIDAIESALGPAGALAFCQGNVLKYVWRAGIKDGEKTAHDFRKAQWYMQRAIEIVERANAG